jgi:hypothetical protein
LEANLLSQELIGEFTGKNVVYRVLPVGRIETTNQGRGILLGLDAYVISTATGNLENAFVGEVNSLIATSEDTSVLLKGSAVSSQSDTGMILTRAATYQKTKSEKLMRLGKVLLLHEYKTDMEGNWTGKIWEWK